MNLLIMHDFCTCMENDIDIILDDTPKNTVNSEDAFAYLDKLITFNWRKRYEYCI